MRQSIRTAATRSVRDLRGHGRIRADDRRDDLGAGEHGDRDGDGAHDDGLLIAVPVQAEADGQGESGLREAEHGSLDAVVHERSDDQPGGGGRGGVDAGLLTGGEVESERGEDLHEHRDEGEP